MLKPAVRRPRRLFSSSFAAPAAVPKRHGARARPLPAHESARQQKNVKGRSVKMIVVMKAQAERMKQEASKKHYLFTRRHHARIDRADYGSEIIQPNDSMETMDKLNIPEGEFRVSMSANDRKMYEKKFIKLAKTRSGKVTSEQVLVLLGPDELDLGIPREEIETHIHQMLTKTYFASKCDTNNLSLEFFLSLAARLPIKSDPMAKNGGTKCNLPIDPESVWKQTWDIGCMILLFYCSFSVPYGIAFLADSNGSISDMEISSLAVDMVFMLDIIFSFLTAVEIDGVMVRKFRKISGVYLRSWFFPDFAGSFPFDTVIAAILENEHDLNSSNFLRFLKFIRMLKLIRAIKFVNKMNKLKQQEGFEVFMHSHPSASRAQTNTSLSLYSEVF